MHSLPCKDISRLDCLQWMRTGVRETNSLSASHSVNATFQVHPGHKHGAISHPQFDSHYNEPIKKRNELGGMRRGCSYLNQSL